MPRSKAPFKISELEDIAKAKDLQAIVVLTVERDGTVSAITYGENKAKCKAIGDWAQGLFKNAVSLIPFKSVFGWGNNGVPDHPMINRRGVLDIVDYLSSTGTPPTMSELLNRYDAINRPQAKSIVLGLINSNHLSLDDNRRLHVVFASKSS